jgi:hypothetical protein
LQREIGAGSFETCHFDVNVVLADGQSIDGVATRVVRRRGHDTPGPEIGDRDGRFGQDSAAGICDRAGDAGGVGLGQCSGGQAEHDDQHCENSGLHISSKAGVAGNGFMHGGSLH